MAKIKIHVDSEMQALKEVAVCLAVNLSEKVETNKDQFKYHSIFRYNPKLVLRQQENFFKVLEDNGVKIHYLKPVAKAEIQLMVRDIGFVIGNTFVIANPHDKKRKREIEGLRRLIDNIDGKVIKAGDCSLEGGDILIEKGNIYVGLSEMTDENGLKFIKKVFGRQHNIIPLKLRKGILHLDTVFNILPKNLALIFPSAFQEEDLKVLSRKFSLLKVNKNEQARYLATNVLSLNIRKVISDSNNKRINKILHSNGLEVIEVDYSEVSKLWGSFRCTTLPLVRE